MPIFNLPTKYFFGKNIINDNLAACLKQLKAKKVVLVYGQGSIKKNGVYQSVYDECKKAKVKCYEFAGVEPNPRDITVDRAVKFIRKIKPSVLIAAGGGSVIDASKVMATLATNPQYKSCWDFVLDPEHTKKPSLNVISIITLAATGSENNAGSVITNSQTEIKTGVDSKIKPIFCFEDPTYTQSAPWYQVCSGIFDIFSHLLEQYYDEGGVFEWSKQYIFANLKTLLNQAEILFKDHDNYEARANILWTSSWALNGLSSFNNAKEDKWMCHHLEHVLSGHWDVAHGMGLALVTPIYLKYMVESNNQYRDMTLELAKNVFNVNSINEFFDKLNVFIKNLSAPVKLTDFKEIKSVSENDIEILINNYLKTYDITKDSVEYKVVTDVIKLLPH